MSFRARRRDANERAIIKALQAAGAVVQQLDGKGVPDLLVGFRGETFLLEVKEPDDGARNSRGPGGRKVANDLGLRESQYDWHMAWKGRAVAIVVTPEQALAVLIGPRLGPGAGVFA